MIRIAQDLQIICLAIGLVCVFTFLIYKINFTISLTKRLSWALDKHIKQHIQQIKSIKKPNATKLGHLDLFSRPKALILGDDANI